MATVAQSSEPLIRKITRDVPNMRNPAVAEEYKRQRAILNAAVESRRAEIEFWESVQTYEGWI